MLPFSPMLTPQNMDLKFQNPNKGRAKAYLEPNGILTFNPAASRMMRIPDGCLYFRIGVNADDPLDKNIYVVISSREDEKAFLLFSNGNGGYNVSIPRILANLGFAYNPTIARQCFDVRYDSKDSCYIFTPIWNP